MVRYRVGSKFSLTPDALENYGDKWSGVHTVRGVYTHYVKPSEMSSDPTGHPGYDPGNGPLYGSDLPFDVYGWEMKAPTKSNPTAGIGTRAQSVRVKTRKGIFPAVAKRVKGKVKIFVTEGVARKINPDLRPVLRTGDLAYYDTFAGSIPCKVLSITGRSGAASSSQEIKVKLTASRGAYKKGEVLTTSGLHVVPKKALFKRRPGARIGYYTVEAQ